MLAKRYADMQLSSQAANKARERSATRGRPSGAEKRVNVNQLKDFYMKRLEAQKAAAASTRAGGTSASGLLGSSGATSAASRNKNRISLPKSDGETSAFVLCLNTNTLENEDNKSLLGKSGTPLHLENLPTDQRVENYNQRLGNFRVTINDRIEKNTLKAGVTRHLTQVKYHLEVAIGWSSVACADIGVLSEHTVQSLGSIVSAALTLVPQEYVISKRVHTIVKEKEKFLRRLKIDAGQLAMRPEDAEDIAEADEDDKADGGKSEVTSVVEMTSNCGTEFTATDITATSKGGTGMMLPNTDVANLSSLQTDMNACKTEEDKRRWFYSQCLTVKLQCPDKDKAKKTLISDIYKQCMEQKIPMERWNSWIREQFGADGASPSPTSPQSPPLRPSSPAIRTSSPSTSKEKSAAAVAGATTRTTQLQLGRAQLATAAAGKNSTATGSSFAGGGYSTTGGPQSTGQTPSMSSSFYNTGTGAPPPPGPGAASRYSSQPTGQSALTASNLNALNSTPGREASAGAGDEFWSSSPRNGAAGGNQGEPKIPPISGSESMANTLNDIATPYTTITNANLHGPSATTTRVVASNTASNTTTSAAPRSAAPPPSTGGSVLSATAQRQQQQAQAQPAGVFQQRPNGFRPLMIGLKPPMIGFQFGAPTRPGAPQ